MPEGVIGVYADAIRAIKILATKDDDRRYLLYLLTYQNQPKPLVSKAATQWAFAETAYNRLLIAFGEQDVLHAAHLVRTATKRMTSGTVMDQKAIGATRNEPWEAFEDILARKNPRGYVRSALIFSENLDSPAAVDVAYKKLVSTSDEAEVLEAARKMTAEKPHFAYKDELEYLKKVLNGSLTFDKPAATLVDYPEYLAWKRFTPGAKVSYANGVWQPEKYGSDHFVPSQVHYRHSYLLQCLCHGDRNTCPRRGVQQDPCFGVGIGRRGPCIQIC